VDPTLHLAELEGHLRTFILTDYHQRPHSETGIPPQTRWEAGGFLPRLPESLEQLDLLLLTMPKARRIHQDGIHFQGLRYLDLTLAAYVGESVTIRYDPSDLAEIRVYYQERFLCRAVCPDLAAQTISLRDIIRARQERRRQLQAGIASRTALVTAFFPPPPPPSPASPSTPPPSPASAPLKRYFND
jgi:putative transposase